MEGSKLESFGLEGDPGLRPLGVARKVFLQPRDGGHAFLFIACGDDEA